MRHKALRYVCLGTAGPQSIHPLGPGLVKGVKAVQLTIKDAAAASFIFGGLIHLQGYCQDDIIIKLRVLDALGGVDGIEGHWHVALIQLIMDVAVSIMLIQDVLPVVRLIWSLKHNFLHPVPVPDNLNSLPWIPFKNRVLADSRINRDLKGSIPDVQDLL